MSVNPVDVIQPQVVKLDLGAGKNPKAGFVGVDRIDFGNGNIVADLRKPWPWADSSVEEFHCSHMLEHFERLERVHILNELYRVCKPGATGQVITPHWNSNRAYGDPTHCWPPVSEISWYYLDKNWRANNAPHTDAQHEPGMYNCDWECTWGYSTHPALQVRAADYQQHAIQWYKEACQDMVCNLKARK